MNLEYEANGYFVIKAFFNESELQELRNVLLEFHASWKNKHFELYSKQAVNSAYITGTEHLTDSKRDVLFKFIGSRKLMDVVLSVIPTHPCFMNTQLFFNPADDRQKIIGIETRNTIFRLRNSGKRCLAQRLYTFVFP